MTFYTDFIYYSGTNTPVANQAVTIKDHGTDTNSTIYDGTGAVIANPTYTDTLGKFEFYVADGAATYDIYVNSVIYDSFSSVTVPEKLDTANPSATGTFTLNGTDLTSDFTKLHAVTASAAELNIMDGVTTTAQQLNYLNTATSNVQSQLNNKAPLGTPYFLNRITLSDDGGTLMEIYGDGFGNTTAQLNSVGMTFNGTCVFTASNTNFYMANLYTGGDLRISSAGDATFNSVAGRAIHSVTSNIGTATSSLSAHDVAVVNYLAGTHTTTLPLASANAGKMLYIKTTQNQAVVSASSNVVPLAGGAASTAILSGTAGKWAILACDGSNWIIMAAN